MWTNKNNMDFPTYSIQLLQLTSHYNTADEENCINSQATFCLGRWGEKVVAVEARKNKIYSLALCTYMFSHVCMYVCMRTYSFIVSFPTSSNTTFWTIFIYCFCDKTKQWKSGDIFSSGMFAFPQERNLYLCIKFGKPTKLVLCSLEKKGIKSVVKIIKCNYLTWIGFLLLIS